MSREIKFRIAEFDEDEKFVGFLYLDATKDKFDSCWLRYDDPLLEIQQFTGLKDKNGVEIYEGDIVGVWDDRTIKKHWKILVKFGEVDFHRDAYTNCIGFFGTEVGCSMPQGLNSALTYQRCEVIGNIYANPELLTP